MEPIVIYTDPMLRPQLSVSDINILIEKAYAEGVADGAKGEPKNLIIHWEILEHPQPLNGKNLIYQINW